MDENYRERMGIPQCEYHTSDLSPGSQRRTLVPMKGQSVTCDAVIDRLWYTVADLPL